MSPKRSLEPGLERIGSYEVLLPLGRGGMATVYLARKEVVSGVTREFAVKLLHAHLRGDPEWATHLIEEAKIAARIRHPHVVEVVEVGDDPQGLFLVLEYIEGETLSGLSRLLRSQNKQLPLPISGRILLDALLGLHAAHELNDVGGKPLGLVHRDFSPQNILIGVDGISRLTDFGIAKAAGRQVTATGVLKGKVAYMSPEQARGHRVDRRCDVWAAGVIAWELLAGRRMHASRNDTDVLLAVISNPPPPLSAIVPKISKQLSDAVESALCFDLSKRCPDAMTLRERLAAAWTTDPGLADREALARFVEAATRESIDARRQQVQELLERRATSSGLALPTGGSYASSGDSLVLGPVEPPAPDITAFNAVTATRKRRLAYRAGGVVLAAAVAVFAVAAALGVFRRAPPREEAPSARPEGTLPSASARAAESAPPVPDVPGASLVVSANANLKRIRIGRRSIDLESPKKRVEVRLLPDELGNALSVEGIDERGTTVRAEVGASEGSVDLNFPVPKPATVSHGTPTKPTKPTKPKPTDVLAPTPFK